MSDKHLFRKKKNDAVEPETMAPDMETQDTLYTLQTASYLPDGTGGGNE